MTRTHFRAIASIIDESSLVNDDYIPKEYLVNTLCDYFECINERFDRDKFKSASSKTNVKELLISKDIR